MTEFCTLFFFNNLFVAVVVVIIKLVQIGKLIIPFHFTYCEQTK